MSAFPQLRLRRLRRTPALRQMLRETQLTKSSLILPLFIKHGSKRKDAISSMPGHFQLSLDNLADEVREIRHLQIPAVLLFGIPEHKDPIAQCSFASDGIISQAIQIIKDVAPELLIITDVCCCEYTDHGHCGIIDSQQQDVDNDATLEVLAQQAVCHAKAGADMVAPSGMMDGQVASIRQALDAKGFSGIPILSYAVKYSSGLYGPFRQAAEGTPKFGDRKSYQMDPGNGLEALREVELDLQEGADLIMVKPAATYLDVIYRIKQKYPHVPMVAYHVSGEFAMIKAAAEKGWIQDIPVALEVLTGLKRAGADLVITYYAKELAKILP